MHLHSRTPEVTVLGQGGHTLRRLRYCRTEVGGPAEERIARTVFNDLGQVQSSADARFIAEGAGRSNFQYQNSPCGQVLRTDSADAGVHHILCDIEGRPMWQRDARGVTQRYAYDVLGRITTRYEHPPEAGHEAVRERFVYGEDEPAETAKTKNLRGQLARRYDPAGLVDHDRGYTLSGAIVRQTRRLLPVDTESDWRGDEEAAWQKPLEPTSYNAAWTYDARGRGIRQTDARGHVQDSGYDIRGRLKYSGVALSGKERRAVLIHQEYNAAGQKLRELSGNGVLTEYAYEPETQRLLHVRAARSSDKAVLQALSYDYDPVGNITALRDGSQKAAYFRNRRTDGDKTYTYDSLYQLIGATGRENAVTSPAPVDIDNPAALAPIDPDHYAPYTRHYRYDAGGNLTRIQHQGNLKYTRNLTIAADNNQVSRIQRENAAPADFTMTYDECGNQRQLDSGQELTWNGLNRLRQVTAVARAQEEDDRESYQYDGGGMRVRKEQRLWNGKTVQRREVIYLPGLELRRTYTDTSTTEDLQMLTVGAAGRSQVRVLNWVTGRPQDIPNQQMRYSLDDHLGSSQLELDQQAQVLTREEYFPYGGTAVRMARSQAEVKYKIIRYSGKERDASGLYYYGHRYYQPWLARWLNPDPAGAVDGLNLYRMVGNDPVNYQDRRGTSRSRAKHLFRFLTFGLRKKGEGAASSAKRGTKIARTILTGLALAGIAFGIASTAGLALGAALGVAAAGFLAGAAIGFFYKKISEKGAGLVAKKIKGKSAKVQAAVAGAWAGITAKVGGATKRGAMVATVVGALSGAVGAAADDSDRGMGGANAAGVAVSTVDIIGGEDTSLAMETGAAVGGAAGGFITGTEGSAEVGENAAYGAWLGGTAGRYVDSAFSYAASYVSKEAIKAGIDYYFEPGKAVKTSVDWAIDKLSDAAASDKPAGTWEWAGSMAGGLVGGVGTAAYQLTKDSSVGHAIEATASTASAYAGYAMDYFKSSVVADSARSLTLDFGKSMVSSVGSFFYG